MERGEDPTPALPVNGEGEETSLPERLCEEGEGERGIITRRDVQMALSPRERTLATVTALVVVVVALITGVRGLLSWAEGSGAHDLAFGTEGLGELLATLDRIDTLEKTNQEIKKSLGNERMNCIDVGKTAELLRIISEAGGRCGMRVTNFNPTPRQKSKPLPSLEVQIAFECQYEQLVRFVDQLDRIEIPVFIQALRVNCKQPGQPQLAGTMTIVTYVYS
jgi:hypothetical protein